jgi:fatty-acyl-CoA synthase
MISKRSPDTQSMSPAVLGSINRAQRCSLPCRSAAHSACRGDGGDVWRSHVVCLPHFDGETAAKLIRQHRVTHLIGGDDMFGRIAAVSAGRRFDSERFSGFAAFHSTAAASITAAEALGMNPRGLYGSSKVQALFSVAEGENRLLGGGIPVSAQARLMVRDPETAVPLPPGASGELWIDAPSRFVGYLRIPQRPNGR